MGFFGQYDPISLLVDAGKDTVNLIKSGVASPSNNKTGNKYTMPGTNSAAGPGSAADKAGKAAQSSADAKNNSYRDASRAAAAARRAAKANKGKTAYDIAARANLNSQYRDQTRLANKINTSRRPATATTPTPPPSGGGGGSGHAHGGSGHAHGGGGSTSSSAGKVPTPPRAPQKPSYDRDMKNAAATKKNTLLKRANAVYGDTRPGADNGEMIQGGASDAKNVTLSGKEFADFKKKFTASHKGSSKNLSDRSLRVMARYMKSRGKGSQFGLPGAPAATPPAEG